MTREEILPIARKHGFAGCEVGVRMVGLINEILDLLNQDKQPGQDGQPA